MTSARTIRVSYNPDTARWRLENTVTIEGVRIHQGFRFDLASIPRPLWPLIAPFELSIEAPLLHDYLYFHRGLGQFTRGQADRMFLKVMKDEGIWAWRRWPAYVAVRLFGGFAWKERDDDQE